MMGNAFDLMKDSLLKKILILLENKISIKQKLENFIVIIFKIHSKNVINVTF